jgi:transposase-like protein
MPRRVGPVKVRQYSREFKLKAVKLSQLPGVEVQAVADALELRQDPPMHQAVVQTGIYSRQGGSPARCTTVRFRLPRLLRSETLPGLRAAQ